MVPRGGIEPPTPPLPIIGPKLPRSSRREIYHNFQGLNGILASLDHPERSRNILARLHQNYTWSTSPLVRGAELLQKQPAEQPREHRAGRLRFFTNLVHLAERDAFAAYLAPLRGPRNVRFWG